MVKFLADDATSTRTSTFACTDSQGTSKSGIVFEIQKRPSTHRKDCKLKPNQRHAICLDSNPLATRSNQPSLQISNRALNTLHCLSDSSLKKFSHLSLLVLLPVHDPTLDIHARADPHALYTLRQTSSRSTDFERQQDFGLHLGQQELNLHTKALVRENADIGGVLDIESAQRLGDIARDSPSGADELQQVLDPGVLLDQTLELGAHEL